MKPRTKKLLAPALSLSFLTAAFTFDQNGVKWFWTELPGVAITLAVGAALTWSFLIISLRSNRKSGA